MATIKRSRTVMVVLSVLTIALVGVATQDLQAFRDRSGDAAEFSIMTDVAVDVNDFSARSEGVCFDAETAAGIVVGGPPPSCPKKLGSCTRVSKNPCCFTCPGVPFLVCVDF